MFPTPYLYADIENMFDGRFDGVCFMQKINCPTIQEEKILLHSTKPANLLQIIRMLSILENSNIVHRDLKPEHLYWCPTGPVLIDFGWSNVLFGSEMRFPPGLGKFRLSDSNFVLNTNPHNPTFSNLNSFGCLLRSMFWEYELDIEPWLAEIIVSMTESIPKRWPSLSEVRHKIQIADTGNATRAIGLGISWKREDHDEFIHNLKMSTDIEILDLKLLPAFSSREEKVKKMTKFYEQSLAEPHVKIQKVDDKRGTEPFLVAILSFRPTYGVFKTTHGLGIAYKNLFNIKITKHDSLKLA